MLNRSLIFSLILAALIMSACEKSHDANNFPPGWGMPAKPHSDWSAYAEQNLAGKIFGQD